jgi:pilus assembly protein CpaB
MKKTLIPVMAVLLGAAGAGLIYQSSLNREKILSDTVEAVTASARIEAGEALSESKLSRVTLPARFCPQGAALEKNKAGLLGQKTLIAVDRGQLILWNFINVNPAEQGLSARLQEGERAVTISVDKRAGLDGALKTGNRVDVLGTFVMPDEGKKRVTRTLLQNLPVLSLGSGGDGGGYTTVTLKVTGKEAELLAFSEGMAELRLTLRGNRDFTIMGELPAIDFSNLKEVEKATKEESLRKKSPRIIYD